ncbi:MAG: ion transporter [Azospirillaceae bacterium]
MWPRANGSLSPVLIGVIGMIVFASVLAILETEPAFTGHPLVAPVLGPLDLALFALFGVEFALRLWAAGEIPRYAGLRGRLRFLARPASLADLAVLVLFGAALAGTDAFLLRLVRLARVVSLTRIGRFTEAGRLLGRAIAERRAELVIALGAALAALVVSAILLYLVEGKAQPAAFGSVPRAMWWSVATLTTVGYGDIYPVTALGRAIASVVALLGIGVIALPAGILAAAISDALQADRRAEAGAQDADGQGEREIERNSL